MLSPATLPGNWGTSMTTGIRDYFLRVSRRHWPRDQRMVRGHSSSKVTQSLDKSRYRLRQTRQEKHGQKNHKVWMVPSANTTNLLRYSRAINYPVLPPNTTYSSNIQSTSLKYSPFPTLLPPYKDSTPNLSTHIRRKSWLGCTTCIFHWAVLFQLLSK